MHNSTNETFVLSALKKISETALFPLLYDNPEVVQKKLHYMREHCRPGWRQGCKMGNEMIKYILGSIYLPEGRLIHIWKEG